MIRLLHGDCRAILPTLPAASVQTVITSPPYYGLRVYSPDDPREIGREATPAAFVAALVAVFAEVWRVLRDDGTLWLNLGDSYANDAKWGGSTGGKHANGLHGATGIGREKRVTGIAGKNLLGMPWRVAFALQDAGWILRSDIIWSKPNPMPESVRDRPTRSHEYMFLFAKQARYYYDALAIAESTGSPSLPVTPRRTNGAAFRGTATRPELNATLYTDQGTVSTQGWCDLGMSQIGVRFPMTPDANGFEVIDSVGFQIGIETPKGVYVMDLQKPATFTATTACIAVALQGFFASGAPIESTIPNIAAEPIGMVFSRHVGADPFPGTFAGAKVTAMECAFVANDILAAHITLESEIGSASLFVWSSLLTAHASGSFLPQHRSNIIPQPTGTRNRRSVWTIATQPYAGSHFATMPEALIAPCILAGSASQACETCGAAWVRVVDERSQSCRCAANTGAARSIVLDPFGGSGTVARVAERYQRDSIMIDLNADYVELQEERTNGVQVEMSL